MNNIRYSRSGSSHPLGKLDSDLPKIKVPERLAHAIASSACESGMSISEYIREVLMIHCFGAQCVQSMYEERIKRITQKGGSNEC